LSLLLFLEQTLNGLQLGVTLFLMAAGLTLVFGIMNMVNLAHGSLYMVGAFFAATFTQWTGSFAFGLGLWLQLSLDRLALLVLTVTAVLVLELLNTATEAVVDLAIGRKYHPLARIAKDCAAAAVLVAAMASMLIAALLLVPPLVARLGL
jgi:diacylglycerol kinase